MAILTAKPKRGSGGHWYTSEGKAMHTVPNAKGDGERNTTCGMPGSISSFLV